jgi:hypothetical protein
MFGVDVFVRGLCLIDLRLPRSSKLKVRVGEHENCKCVLFKDTFIFEVYKALIMGKTLITQWWNNIDGVKPKYSEKITVPMPLYPPQIPHGLAWD